MKNPIKIEENYKFIGNLLLSSRQSLFMPVISGIIVNKKTGIPFNFSDTFLLDTGGSLSILCPKYESFFDKAHIIDHQNIKYGNCQAKLPVYDISINIQGFAFDLKAALDNNLTFMVILGNYLFLDQFSSIILNPKIKKTTILKKYSTEV